MASTAALATSSETFTKYSARTAADDRSENLRLLARGLAGAMALGIGLAATVPTVGLPNTAVSDKSSAGEPPDLGLPFPTAWTGLLSLQKVLSDFDRTEVKALAELNRLRAYSSGWDGPRSYAPIAESFNIAERFVRMLAEKHPNLKVRPTLFARGTAAIEIAGDNFEALVEFNADGSLAAAVDRPDFSADFDWPELAAELPRELVALI